MGQCRTLDADVNIGRHYGDYSSCDNTIPTSLLFGTNFFTHSNNTRWGHSSCQM